MSKPNVQSKALGKKEKETFALKKKIGLWSGVAITTGSIVGSGIFVSPTGVLRSVNGSIGLSLCIWFCCGLISMSSCLCYSELGSSLKASGQDFKSFKLVYGPVISFIYVWSAVFLRGCGIAATYHIFARYLSAPFFKGCNPPENIIKLVALLLIFVLVFINYKSVKKSVKFEVVFTVTKFLAMLLIAVVGIVHLRKGNSVGLKNFENGFDSESLSQLGISEISNAFYQGMFAYSGFDVLTLVSEEIKQPGKNLPRASILSLLSVIIIYMLVNVGYFSVLTPTEMISSKAVAQLFGFKVLGPMAWLISFFVCASTTGHLNGAVLLGSRLPFVASREGLGPQVLGMIHTRHFTPAPSIILNAAVASIFIWIGDFNSLVTSSSFFMWMVLGLSASSVLLLRRKFPNLERPYKAPIVCPIFTVITSVYFIVTPFARNPNPVYFVGIGIYAIALLCYYVFIKIKLKIPGMTKFNLFLQKLLEVAETDCNEDELQQRCK